MKKIISFELEILIRAKYIHKVYLFDDYKEACKAADNLYQHNKMDECIIKIYRVEKTQEVMPWPSR